MKRRAAGHCERSGPVFMTPGAVDTFSHMVVTAAHTSEKSTFGVLIQYPSILMLDNMFKVINFKNQKGSDIIFEDILTLKPGTKD
ncbi:hypothetical protein BTVI_42169 [Pitangus sulphuratus]|nr:hypothetical protein BTVI_42169 [Pitangus sulphuratus]